MGIKAMEKIAALALLLCATAWNQNAQDDNKGEAYRPQYHFSPRLHWTNDPNGLVFFDGEYHLFFQYNPFGDKWGHMSWGHAVSRDLLHWDELPVALPEKNGVMIFTGSIVIDQNNSSGFCIGGKPCLVAIYTGHTPEQKGKPALQTQNLAYSNDRGRTWTKYAGNPVLDLHMSDFRDPKALWSDVRKEWVMAVALPNDHKVYLYHAKDLKHWDKMSEFGPAGATGGQWECPELFETPVENKPGESHWVMKVGLNPGGLQGGSGEQYFVGNFDGTQFANSNGPGTTLWTDYGKDCYCALSFSGLPKTRPAPIAIGWMDNWQYAADLPTAPPWRGQMTVPRELGLRETPEGLRLVQKPVPAMAGLRMGMREASGVDVHAVNELLAREDHALGHASEAELEIGMGSGQEVSVTIGSASIGYNRKDGKLFVDRTHAGTVDFSKDFPVRVEAPLHLAGSTLKLHLLADGDSLELFADDGLVTITSLWFPAPEKLHLQIDSGAEKLERVQVHFWDLQTAAK